jgi:hypothetical protein
MTKAYSSGRVHALRRSEFPRYPLVGKHWILSCAHEHREQLRGGLDTSQWYGFIYKVTFLLDGVKYVGKKPFHRASKWGTPKAPSNWRVYTSSSDIIEQLLQEYPMECFLFEIVMLCPTKAIMSHAESNILHKVDALTEKDEHGHRHYLNGRVEPVRWLTRDYNGPWVTSQVEKYIINSVLP